MSLFNLYNEIEKEYENLIPLKQEGLVLFHLVLLFSPSLDILIHPEHCKLWVRKKQGEIYP